MNIRWAELADFMLGWTTLDIAHDDGKLARNNPWPPESPAQAE